MLGSALQVLTRHSNGHNPDRLRWYFLYFWQTLSSLCCCGVAPVNFKLEVLWGRWFLLMLSRVKLFQVQMIELLAVCCFLGKWENLSFLSNQQIRFLCLSWNRYLNQWFKFLFCSFWLMCLCQSWIEIWVFNVNLNDLFHLKSNLSFLF